MVTREYEAADRFLQLAEQRPLGDTKYFLTQRVRLELVRQNFSAAVRAAGSLLDAAPDDPETTKIYEDAVEATIDWYENL